MRSMCHATLANEETLGEDPEGFGRFRHPTRREDLPVGVISRHRRQFLANPIADVLMGELLAPG